MVKCICRFFGAFLPYFEGLCKVKALYTPGKADRLPNPERELFGTGWERMTGNQGQDTEQR